LILAVCQAGLIFIAVKLLSSPLDRSLRCEGFHELDAQLAAFFLLYGNDIDALPYTIIDLASNTAEQAGFVPTDATDLAEVQNWPSCPGNYWYPGCSAFHGVWIATVGQITPPVLKLICTGNNVTLIQGLVYIVSFH
jgi:hypothetical protein